MKIRLGFAWSAVALLSLGGSSVFAADPYGSASMLPLPSVNAPVASVARANPNGQPAVQGQWANHTADEEVAPPPANVDGDYAAALENNGWGNSNCADGSCGGDNVCGDSCFGGCGSYWFGGVYGLLMTRDRENNLGLGYVTVGNQVLHSRDADIRWAGGYEARLGHMCGDCSGSSGWEVVFWNLPQTSGYAQATQDEFGLPIQSDLSMNNLNFGPNNATDWFDNADIASVSIQDTYYNLELNFLTVQGYGYNFGGSRLSFGASAGARWFRFDENFLYGVDVDANSDDPTESAYYNINMTNDLVGAQIGFLANYAATQRFSLFSEVKMGVFANYMQQSQLIAQGDGTVATINNGPNNGTAWDFKSNKTDVSFLGELRLGGRFQISQNWSATAAYRAIAVTGVAFTTEQVPVNMGDIHGAENIDSNGSLILHGIQVGAEYRF